MQIPKELTSLFLPGDRARGLEYYRMNRVSDIRECDGVVSADVRGSGETYSVSLDLLQSSDDLLSCTCPRFEDGYYCKHIWAALLAFVDLAQGNDKENLRQNKSNRRVAGSAKGARTKQPDWQRLFRGGRESVDYRSIESRDGFHSVKAGNGARSFRYLYVFDVGASKQSSGYLEGLSLRLLRQEIKQNGGWSKPRVMGIDPNQDCELMDSADRLATGLLLGKHPSGYGGYYSVNTFAVKDNWDLLILQAIEATGRLYWSLDARHSAEEFRPLRIDWEGRYSIWVELRETKKDASEIHVELRRGELRVPSREIVWIGSDGLALLLDRLIRIENVEAIPFLRNALQIGQTSLKGDERGGFLRMLSKTRMSPLVEIPPSWHVQQESRMPRGRLTIRPTRYRKDRLNVNLHFVYGEFPVEFRSHARLYYDPEATTLITRALDAERKLLSELQPFKLTETRYYDREADFELHPKHFDQLVQSLGGQGWQVLWEGKLVRQPGAFQVSVVTENDWFELKGGVDYDGQVVPLPQLLKALEKKQQFVTLADGSQARVPNELLARYAELAQFGDRSEGGIRFRSNQGMLFDALLESQPPVAVDHGFQEYRERLARFSGIQAADAPRGFVGSLRDYQREGLGWLHFLLDFNFGGCLADDMGLGKTIQVLSLLESRRQRPTDSTLLDNGSSARRGARDKNVESTCPLDRLVRLSPRKPSIVVVPKSLVFNWFDEAARFVPGLRLLNFTGVERKERVSAMLESGEGFDVLVTTYGTLRTEIPRLCQIPFDYAVLDESQAIKNAGAQTAKACRLLNADHRLAMTGTPIENHLGELWSLFEFLNPGMLGRSAQFAALTTGLRTAESAEATLGILSRALKPFILRRTKTQVLKDLPAKTEQTLFCDMAPTQRKQYDELREFYRVQLTKRIEAKGIQRSKIHVLEALLRLRQVSCDPRLLDPKAKPGVKLSLLQEQLEEVVSEGHKVLIFSQFTSLLGLFREQLDAQGQPYQYLDGQTRNRAAVVKKFQNDPAVKIFLISLKAGGHGLNLTAADYVFILDPWWNPAVEAQAIDRAHRIGQRSPVMAYRLICRDSVEEKILSLQATKRELADSIIAANDSVLGSLSLDDLQLLLS